MLFMYKTPFLVQQNSTFAYNLVSVIYIPRKMLLQLSISSLGREKKHVTPLTRTDYHPNIFD